MAKKDDKKIIQGPRGDLRGETEIPFSCVHARLMLLQGRKLIGKWSKLAKLNRWELWVISHHLINASRMSAT